MLRQTYTRGKQKRAELWYQLESFFEALKTDDCAFLSMNWDTVIEEGLIRNQSAKFFDYGCDARAAQFKEGKLVPRLMAGDKATVIKMHGSTNWLYCDACRTTYWVPPGGSLQVADVLLKDSDWGVIYRLTGAKSKQKKQPICPLCGAKALGTRFATFSYRKALEFPMFERSWLSAERLLRKAENWIFVGYSLPAADYQFKHLLKQVQLSRKEKPNIILVSGGGMQAENTLRSYQKFFGPKISSRNGSFFDEGLDEDALTLLGKIGALERSD